MEGGRKAGWRAAKLEGLRGFGVTEWMERMPLQYPSLPVSYGHSFRPGVLELRAGSSPCISRRREPGTDNMSSILSSRPQVHCQPECSQMGHCLFHPFPGACCGAEWQQSQHTLKGRQVLWGGTERSPGGSEALDWAKHR